MDSDALLAGLGRVLRHAHRLGKFLEEVVGLAERIRSFAGVEHRLGVLTGRARLGGVDSGLFGHKRGAVGVDDGGIPSLEREAGPANPAGKGRGDGV